MSGSWISRMDISYDSDMKKAKEILSGLLQDDPDIMKDREIQVFVDALCDSSVRIGCRSWVKTESYWPTRWRLNEKIKLAFDEAGIVIPYPQMDVHIQNHSQDTERKQEKMIAELYRNMLGAKSVIRETFAYGSRRAEEIGYENVFDYSLGNPSVPAPDKLTERLISLLKQKVLQNCTDTARHWEIRKPGRRWRNPCRTVFIWIIRRNIFL